MSSPPLSVRNLSLTEEETEERLFNFDVQNGEIVVVLGSNGSGKSLMHSSLSGQRVSDSGEVLVHGCDLYGRRTRTQALEKLGSVFQHPGLLRTLSVFDNVALPFLERSLEISGKLSEMVRLRLDLLGCGHLADVEPAMLSEGDKRCVAMARALSGETRVLLADEPAAGLSFDKRTRMEELLRCLVAGGALDCVVIFTQDVEFAMHVGQRFLFLKEPDPRAEHLGGIREERSLTTLMDEPSPPEVAMYMRNRKALLK